MPAGSSAVTEANMNIKIAPSILSADFVRLADEVEEIKQAALTMCTWM